MTLKEIISQSKVVKKANSGFFYLNCGKALLGKFTTLSGEISLLILVLTEVVGYDLKSHRLVFLGIIAALVIGLIIVGYVYTHSGLLQVEQLVNNNKSPVDKIKLDAAQKILKSKKI
jgi:hypothetical protein